MVQTINPVLTGSITSSIPGVTKNSTETGGFDAYLQSILSLNSSEAENVLSDESRIEISYRDEQASHDKGKSPVDDRPNEKLHDAAREEANSPVNDELKQQGLRKEREPLGISKKNREKKLAFQVVIDPNHFALQEKERPDMGKLAGKKGLLQSLRGKRLKGNHFLKVSLKDVSPGLRKDIKNIFSGLNKKGLSLDQLKDRLLSALQSENLIKPLKSGSDKQKANIKILDLTENSKSDAENPLKGLALKDLHAGEKQNSENALTQDPGKVKSAAGPGKSLFERDVKKASSKAGKGLENEKAVEEKSEIFDIKTGDDKKMDLNPGISKSGGASRDNQGTQVQRALADNKQRILDQVAGNTKVIVANKETSFSTMLRPESLGRVDMKFSMKDGKLSGKIILQNQEAADFFRANVEDIRAVFSKSDVEMGNIDVLVAGKDSGMGSGNEHFQSGSGSSEGQEAEKAAPAAAREYSAVQDVFEENSLQRGGEYSLRGDSRINVVI